MGLEEGALSMGVRGKNGSQPGRTAHGPYQGEANGSKEL